MDKEHGRGQWSFTAGSDQLNSDGLLEKTPFAEYSMYVGQVYAGCLEGHGELTLKNGDFYKV